MAELDDLSGVGLMALLLAIVPVLHAGDGDTLLRAVTLAAGSFMVKAGAFGALCFFLARYGEQRISRVLKLSRPLDALLIVIGVVILISAAATLLGFTLAIGTFFAGLIFGRDPKAVKLEGRFLALDAFFAPFFFIGIAGCASIRRRSRQALGSEASCCWSRSWARSPAPGARP